MKQNTALKQALFALLVFLLIGDLVLLLANGFFAYKLYLSPQPISEDSAISGTQQALTQTQSALPSDLPTETQPAATETMQPSPESTATEQAPTASPTPELVVNGIYTVRENETLPAIAALLGLTEDDLRNANQMVGSTIFTGQKLRVPENIPSAVFTYQFSSRNEADQYSVKYPAANASPVQVVLLADPSQNPANALEPLYTLAEASLAEVNSILQLKSDTALQIITTGTLLEGNPLVRTFTGTEPDTVYILYDGTGSQLDQQRWMMYESARLIAEKAWGTASSEMIREGTAWMAANENIADNDEILPMQQQCKSFLDANVLPALTDEALVFGGENTHWINQYTAACFMDYLFQKTTVDEFKLFYHDGDYETHFGATLETLEAEFRQWLTGLPASENMPQEWAAAVNRFNTLFRDFMPTFSGSPDDIEIYRQLDMARMALLRNELLEAETHLIRAEALLAQ